MESAIILIIDDEPVTLKLLEEQLSPLGYRIFTSLSGMQGIETAKSLNPNLIMLDLKMPHMDGFQVLKNLREDEITKNIPIMMLTSVKERDTVIKAMRSGVVDYTVKPYDIDSMRNKIKSALHYSEMKRRELAEEKSERIFTSRDDEMILISFRSNLREKELLSEARTVFNPVFFKQIMNRICIIDLRGVLDFEPADVRILEVLVKLFADREVLLVAGRHYGMIAAEANFEDSTQIFISFGDMELYRTKKKLAINHQ